MDGETWLKVGEILFKTVLFMRRGKRRTEGIRERFLRRGEKEAAYTNEIEECTKGTKTYKVLLVGLVELSIRLSQGKFGLYSSVDDNLHGYFKLRKRYKKL
ncbi:hypothetical protein BUALT_Bualt13G0112600 [Buddleja alternifolia]|uniref:Uncharacterized protein n=1 Tax=Buddleja alternifolia TaxID=168488 RepID=A0AAV6WVK5_9LAMI|nr:hypothetical protein BUALT_Bualt13G0112600 [Buddleja alternifolia]